VLLVVLESHIDYHLLYLKLYILLLLNLNTVICGDRLIFHPQMISYYINFVDAYSKFTWIYFLKNKSETFSVLQQFKTMTELQFDAKIKRVQTDWGSEFRPLTSFLQTHGIIHRLICPHTHHQNGIVERKHMHIVELGLTHLKQASLPLKFLDFAFQTAVYLIFFLSAKINIYVY